MDADGNGSLTANELKIPLIGLGLVNSVDEVRDIMFPHDKDRSGGLEFEEFL